MPDQPNEETVRQARDGNRAAFRLLVEQYQGFVYATAYHLLGSQAEAEDAVQETWVKVWRNLLSYRTEVKFTTWLYRVVVNHCLDVQKTAWWRRRLPWTGKVEVPDDPPSPDQTSDTLIEEITEAAALLPHLQKVVFVLRDLQSLSVAEVCRITRLQETQVKSNLYYARKQVYTRLQRKKIDQHGDL